MAKIMLVEDDNNLREIYGARLAAEGHEIVAAKDGEEALAMAVKEKPDLVISDVMMPRISGFDMLDILRNAPETKYTKVIMMTALSQAEDKARADKLGADRYLVKSQVTLEDVAKVVREVLGLEDPQSAETPESVTPSAPSQQPPTTDPVTADPAPSMTSTLPPEPQVIAQPMTADSTSAPVTSAASTPVVTSAAAATAIIAAPTSPTSTQPLTPAPTAATGAPVITTPPPVPAPAPPPVANDATVQTAAGEAPDAKINPDPPDGTKTTTAPTGPPAVTPLTTPELAAAEKLVETPADKEQFIGPSLEQALAAEQSIDDQASPAPSLTANPAPTIINGVNQSGLISPAPTPATPPPDTTPDASAADTPTAEPARPPAAPTVTELPTTPPVPVPPPVKPAEAKPLPAPPPEPHVIKPTVSVAQAGTAPPVETAPTAPANLLDEDNPHKKVIQPLHDPHATPDFDALLAKEAAHAAATNPPAGSAVKPVQSAPPPPASPPAPAADSDLAI